MVRLSTTHFGTIRLNLDTYFQSTTSNAHLIHSLSTPRAHIHIETPNLPLYPTLPLTAPVPFSLYPPSPPPPPHKSQYPPPALPHINHFITYFIHPSICHPFSSSPNSKSTVSPLFHLLSTHHSPRPPPPSFFSHPKPIHSSLLPPYTIRSYPILFQRTQA